MSTVIAIGISHRTAPLSLLEQLTIDPDSVEKYLHDLVSRDHITEAVILSTCNRTEVVVTAEKFHGAFRDLRDFIGDLTFLAPEDFADHLVVSHDQDAVRHLFAIAAGLESVVIGEHEILGQVRDAWTEAQRAGTSKTTLNLLFRHAIEAGKRARTDTDISRHVTSVSHASVVMAAEYLGTMGDRTVAVLGAGSMARGVVDFCQASGTAEVTVLNRTVENARTLAVDEQHSGSLDRIPEQLAVADVVFCATSAPGGVVTTDMVRDAMAERNGRPLLLVDIAMPRDVEASSRDIDGVTLLDMEGLGAFVERGLSQRRQQVPAVELIVDEEVDRFLAASSARSVAPLITDLRRRGETAVADEIERYSSRLDQLGPAEREFVESMLHGVVAKLLHEPTVALKASAGTPRGERLVGSLRELFDL